MKITVEIIEREMDGTIVLKNSRGDTLTITNKEAQEFFYDLEPKAIESLTNQK